MSDEFGGALRTLRNEAGLTQDQLADAAGVAGRTVRRLEAGKTPDTRVTTVRMIVDALAEALGRDQKELLRELTALRPAEAAPPNPVSQQAESAPDVIAVSSDTDGAGVPTARHRGPARPKPGLSGLRAAADNLANNVRDRWIREEEQRRVHDPSPLPVRWHSVRRGLVDDLAEAQAARPETDPSAALSSSGTLADIAPAYRSVDRGRLVVLGRAGSGKTVLAIRFVVDYVDTREPDDPVPVVFSLSAWNPTAITLRDWLAHRLLRDHPELGISAPAPSTATLGAALLAAGWILPVLDGFDEIAEDLQGVALKELNASTLPFLLTSRTAQFEKAVSATRALKRAAGIELDDLTVADLAEYLPGTAPPGKGNPEGASMWQPVLDAIDEQPEKEECIRLVEVLRTPLMVLLARTIYSDVPGRDPADLLEENRFRDVEALEQHLLAGFVPALYQDSPRPLAVNGSGRAHKRPGRTWTSDEVLRYMAYIAAHLSRSQNRAGQDLAWWRLCDSVRPIWRVVAVTLAGVLVTSIAYLIVGIPVHLLVVSHSLNPEAYVMECCFIGLVVGMSFALVYVLLVLSGRFPIKPSRVQIRLSWRRGHSPSPAGCMRFVVWSAFGFLGGIALGCGYGLATTVEILLLGFGGHQSLGTIISVTTTNMAVYSLIFGLAASLAFGLMITLTVPDDVSAAPTPLSLLAANRTTALRQLLVLIPLLSLTIGLGGAAVVAALQGLLGPLIWSPEAATVIGISGGVIGVTMYILTFTAWGQWILLARLWLPMTGRLPWATAAFLDDAYRRGLLRQSGAVYQFRHARLQAQLSDSDQR